MKIKGTITRVVERNERAGELANRVFMTPDDLSVFRELDGSKRAGHNEISVAVEAVTGYKVGAPCELNSDDSSIHSLTPAAKPAAEPAAERAA